MLQKLWIASRQPNGTLISLKSKAPISATTSRLQSHSSWQKWFWWLSKQRCFMLLVMPLYFPMLLTQYAPKTRIIMLLSCHFVFPCFWHNMLQGQESLYFCHATLFSHASDTICSKDKNEESYNSFPTFWGKKWNLLFTVTIHVSLFTVTIHSEFLPI